MSCRVYMVRWDYGSAQGVTVWCGPWRAGRGLPPGVDGLYALFGAHGVAGSWGEQSNAGGVTHIEAAKVTVPM
jgi:hypothetical protein